MDMIAQIISGLLQGLYAIIESIASSTSPSKENIKDHIVKNEVIQERLVNLLNEVGADRINIRQYHNGGYFYSGLPLQKYSCTYEAVSEGIAPVMWDRQNRLVSEAPPIHSAIVKDNLYAVSDITTLTDMTTKQKLGMMGVKSCYVVGIWDIQQNLIGLIFVDYIKQSHVFGSDEKLMLEKFANLVSGYLVPTPGEKRKGKKTSMIVFGFLSMFILGQVVSFAVCVFNIVKLILAH